MIYNGKYSLKTWVKILKEEQLPLFDLQDIPRSDKEELANISAEDITPETINQPISSDTQLTFADFSHKVTGEFLSFIPSAEDVLSTGNGDEPTSGSLADIKPFMNLLKQHFLNNPKLNLTKKEANGIVNAIAGIDQSGAVAARSTFDLGESLKKMRNPDSRHQKVTVARARLGIGVAKDAFGMRGQNIRDPGEDEGRPGDTGGNFGFLYMNEHFGLPRAANGKYDLSNPTKKYEKRMLGAIAKIRMVSKVNNSEPGTPGESLVHQQFGWNDTNVDGTSMFADASDGSFDHTAAGLYSVKTSFSNPDPYGNTPTHMQAIKTLFLYMYRKKVEGTGGNPTGEERERIMELPGFDDFELNIGSAGISIKDNQIICKIIGPVRVKGSEIKLHIEEKRRDYDLNTTAKLTSLFAGLSLQNPRTTIGFRINLPEDFEENLKVYSEEVWPGGAGSYDPSQVNFDESFNRTLKQLFEWAVK